MLQNEYYQGSRIFSGLSDLIHLSVDQINFVVSQLVALGLAVVYRTALHPSKSTAEMRHVFGLVFGVLIGYFCFGNQAVHLVGLPLVCYVLITTQKPYWVHGLVLVVSLGYVSCLHLQRQLYFYGSYGMDISGPLMVITQKVSSLAFSLHDGATKKPNEMTELQRTYAVYKTPSFLEYFGYVLMFPTLLAGPVIFYKDYIDFIENKTIPDSPVKVVTKKLIVATLCVLVFLQFVSKFPIARIKDDGFIENTSFVYKFWYLSVSTSVVRFKYYFAWTLADAICNNCAMGFSGHGEDDATSKWDKLTNVDVFQFEFGTSLKQSIDAWNKGTNLWLRMVVYDRAKKHGALLTYVLSAVWHGFYPGYYLTFLSGALFTFAARAMRRTVRGHFRHAMLFYDLMTFVVTRFVMAYLTFPFVLLEFWPSVRLYNKMGWVLHWAALLALFLVPRIVPKPSENTGTQRSGIAMALKHAGPYSNTND